MRSSPSSLSRAVRSLAQLRPAKEDFDRFRKNLATLIAKTEEVRKTSTSGALEESEKNLLNHFLHDTFYGAPYHVGNLNYKGNTGADLAIRSAKNNTLVLFECKAGNNAQEMPTQEDLLRKAFLEAVAYYCFEKEELKNDHLKHVVITNTREWFVFDAADFRAATHGKAKVRDAFTQWNKGNWDNATTAALHKRLAEILAASDDTLAGYHVDLWAYRKYLERDDDEARAELLKLYRFLGPGFLLKEGSGKDSNTLNKGFYNELLHILGLHEAKEGGVKRIKRLPEGKRHQGMLIENAIVRLKNDGKFARLENKEHFGATEEEQLFAVGMELCITWLDRILFLKLLEAQLLRYHGGDRQYAFLTPTDEGQQYDYLNTFFFDVMAKENSEREAEVQQQFGHIPYLNSTLFVPSDLEDRTLLISNLKDGLKVPLHDKSILIQKKLSVHELQALDYLLRFLDAYDFGSTPGETFTDANRPLITASVLGLIFEKLNGYKDGSFYTPGFITMYMCRETLRPAVVQRFNERFGLALTGFDALQNHCAKLNEQQEIAAAERVIDDLRICDPAVGSGHFLVSALNELLAIKSELGLLTDADGKPLHKWTVAVANDEITIQDQDDVPFKYLVPPGGNAIPAEMQRVQRALFEQKRKLIEGCLFGVDINPNSVKICRLRLWIELLKNAYYLKADGKELRTLPNIDINIKRGNSLFSRFKLSDNIEQIMERTTYTADQYKGFVQDYKEANDPATRAGIEKILHGIEGQFNAFSQGRDPRVKKRSELAKELDTLTGGMFGGSQGYTTEAAKKKAQKRIGQLEKEINGLSAEIAEESRGFAFGGAFEWRYAFPEILSDAGEYGGFDVVVANPPYLRARSAGSAEKSYYQRSYEVVENQFDLFHLFIERAHGIVQKQGWVSLIVPNTVMANENSQRLRKYLLDKYAILSLVDFRKDVFEDVGVEVAILFLRKPQASNTARYYEGTETGIQYKHEFNPQSFRTNRGLNFTVTLDDRGSSLLRRIDDQAQRLDELFEVVTGIKEYQVGKGDPPQTALQVEGRVFNASRRVDQTFRPELRGKNLRPFGYDWENEHIAYGKWLAEPREERFFTGRRVLVRQIPGNDSLIAAIVDQDFVVDQSVFIVKRKPDTELSENYLLGLLNSKLLCWYFRNMNNEYDSMFPKVKAKELKALPIVVATSAIRHQLEALVAARLGEEASSAKAQQLEQEIDAVVYGVYGLSEEERKVVEGEKAALE